MNNSDFMVEFRAVPESPGKKKANINQILTFGFMIRILYNKLMA